MICCVILVTVSVTRTRRAMLMPLRSHRILSPSHHRPIFVDASPVKASAALRRSRLRDRFFPGEQIIRSLEYLTLKEGQIQAQRTLVRHVEDADGPVSHLARFHVLADGTLLILGQFTGVDSGTTYRIAEINDDHPEWIDIPFKHPMSGIFLTNTIRSGSSPSSYIDIVGMSPTKPHTLGYARVEIGD